MSGEVIELLNGLDVLENDIFKNMLEHEDEIIRGIELVRYIVKKINLEQVDNEFKKQLLFNIRKYQKNLLEKNIVMDEYMMYGIDKSLLMVDIMIGSNNSYSDKKIKIKKHNK